VSALGVRYETDALEEMVKLTQGYPYFLQEWGYQTWNQAETRPLTLDVVRGARPAITQRLDENFFRVRFDRLTPAEKLFLRGMAELGSQACRIGDISHHFSLAADNFAVSSAKEESRETSVQRRELYSQLPRELF